MVCDVQMVLSEQNYTSNTIYSMSKEAAIAVELYMKYKYKSSSSNHELPSESLCS